MDAIISLVAHPNVSERVERNSADHVELTIPAAGTPKLSEVLARQTVKDLDAIVERIAYKNVVRAIYR